MNKIKPHWFDWHLGQCLSIPKKTIHNSIKYKPGQKWGQKSGFKEDSAKKN